jgi:hypothetical protein
MKNYTLLLRKVFLMLFFFGGLFLPSAMAQCSAYFQSAYNATTGDVDFTQLCTYDTSIHPLVFMWDFGDGTAITEENPSHHYSVSGNYVVCLFLFVGNGPGCCQDTFCEMVDFSPTTVQKNSVPINNLAITVSGKNLSVYFSLDELKALRFSLVSLTGQANILGAEPAIDHGRNNLHFSLTGYPAGIYLLRIEDEEGNSLVRKLVLN